MSNTRGLTVTIIVEAEGANYGETVGNVVTLKKISRDGGRSYPYISRIAMRYNMINQMGYDCTPLGLDKETIQFAYDATIKDYPEIDLFGYMKTIKPVKTRPAVVRLSNAISLEPFNGDVDFSINKGLLDRYNENNSKPKDGGNIVQSEIHKSYYCYTITIDLDKVGIDLNDNITISNKEKANRVSKLLDTIKFLYRDIKGRSESLLPIFAIGGVYSIKNPFFENRVKCFNNAINIEPIESILKLEEEIKTNTKVGLIKGVFRNNDEIISKLGAIEMKNFFEGLKNDVKEYYMKEE